MKISALIALFSCLPLVLAGQQPLAIDNLFYQDTLNGWFDCSSFVEIRRGLPDSLGLEEVTALDTGWTRLSEAENFSWTDNCWMRLSLRNERAAAAELVLLVHADAWDAWLWRDGRASARQTGGNLRPRHQWNSRQHAPAFSSPHTLQFELPKDSMSTLYLKLGANDQGLRLQPKLGNRSFFLSHSTSYFNRSIATQAFFHGVLWVMLLFHFLSFLMNRDGAYLYYTAYILALSISLFYSFGSQHYTVLADFPRLSRHLLLAGTYGFIIFYTQFLLKFLHQGYWRRGLEKLLTAYSRAAILFGVLTQLLLFLPPSVFRITHSYWMLLPLALVGLFGLVYISYRYWRSGRPLARYIAATNFFMLCGMIASTFIYYAGILHWIPLLTSTFLGILFLELMIIFQLLSFSMSLSYKALESERERIRLSELDQLKSRFFAHISHEFRTPLALILGPLGQLKATVNQPTGRQQLQTAETYARKLLRLVNQILDLARLDARQLQLKPQLFDIVGTAKAITYSFESIAQEQSVRLAFKCNKESWEVLLDKEKVEQILINLIGNAVKYNRKEGKVQVRLDIVRNRTLLIEVRDTGRGIPQEGLPYIFQLYYQAHQDGHVAEGQGSGIGLALTKELAELQGGTIHAESQEGQGATFSVEIPLPPTSKEEGRPTWQAGEALPEKPLRWAESPEAGNGQKPTVLLVEDHEDIRGYIQSCLQDSFQLLLADDGKKGLEIARRQVPDLIITDVMMPVMDGFALTQALKEGQATSHIPVIILTGKSSKASRLEGLSRQADAYLAKPFDVEELQLRIQNLLDNRQRWIAHYQQQSQEPAAASPLPSMEARFLENVRQLVQENLSNEHYSVEQLGRSLRLDRTQLFRKLKAITGQNPSQFIRAYRLEAAYQLLKNRTSTVAEIAFQVGFSNPSYFSRSFKAHFGKTPGEVMKEFNS